MTHKKDYIPSKQSDFTPWAQGFLQYLDKMCGGGTPAWTHIPPEARAKLAAKLDEWKAAYAAAVRSATPVSNQNKREALVMAAKTFRTFVNDYLRGDPVREFDLKCMGVLSSYPFKPHRGAPKTGVRLHIRGFLPDRRMRVSFQDTTIVRSRAIPYGYKGCVLAFAVGRQKAADHAQLTRTILMTRSPCTVDLGIMPEDAGLWLSAAVCWKSKTGELGHWGEISIAVIP
jgi:hypothetical protein